MHLKEHILKEVDKEFNLKIMPYLTPSSYKIYIFFCISDAMILFEDRKIPYNLLEELLHEGKIISEGLHIHQGEKCIRYKFVGYKYPYKYYRSIPAFLRKQVLERYKHRCCECYSDRRLEIDHIYAWSKGGYTEESNLQVLCKSCNIKKHKN